MDQILEFKKLIQHKFTINDELADKYLIGRKNQIDFAVKTFLLNQQLKEDYPHYFIQNSLQCEHIFVTYNKDFGATIKINVHPLLKLLRKKKLSEENVTVIIVTLLEDMLHNKENNVSNHNEVILDMCKLCFKDLLFIKNIDEKLINFGKDLACSYPFKTKVIHLTNLSIVYKIATEITKQFLNPELRDRVKTNVKDN
jgi:hypothetical protein